MRLGGDAPNFVITICPYVFIYIAAYVIFSEECTLFLAYVIYVYAQIWQILDASSSFVFLFDIIILTSIHGVCQCAGKNAVQCGITRLFYCIVNCAHIVIS